MAMPISTVGDLSIAKRAPSLDVLDNSISPSLVARATHVHYKDVPKGREGPPKGRESLRTAREEDPRNPWAPYDRNMNRPPPGTPIHNREP